MMLTARGDEADRIVGLELLARVWAENRPEGGARAASHSLLRQLISSRQPQLWLADRR